MAGHKLAVMLDGDIHTKFFPIFGDSADTVRTNGDDLFYAGLAESFEVGFGQLPEHEIVAQAPGGIAGTLFFFEHAVRSSQVTHDGGKGRDDFPSARIVGSHASEP